jgi:hypothetical protein
VPDPRRILRVVIAALRIWSRKQIWRGNYNVRNV